MTAAQKQNALSSESGDPLTLTGAQRKIAALEAWDEAGRCAKASRHFEGPPC